MEKGKKIIYTESAQNRLTKLQADLQEKIENFLRYKKNVPGDDFIEITANDIDYVSDRIKIIKSSKSSVRYLIILVYGITGVIMTIFGLFYDYIKQLVQENPSGLIISLSGIFISVFSIAYYYLMKQRDAKEKNYLIEKQIRKYLLEKDLDNEEKPTPNNAS